MKWLSKFFDRVNPRIVEARKIKLHNANDDVIKLLEVKWSDGRTTQYKGSGTVWRSYPMMERHTSMEFELTNINRYLKQHGNPYPTAHENYGKGL